MSEPVSALQDELVPVGEPVAESRARRALLKRLADVVSLPGSRVTAAATAARTFSETIFPSISSAGMGASRQR